MTNEWDAGALLGLSGAYWRGCALQAGVSLKIFSAISSKTLSLSDIALQTGSDSRGMEYLLNALTAMGLLGKNDGTYANSAAALQYLCIDSPDYIGHIILHHYHILDGWAQLDEAVRSGRPAERRSHGTDRERTTKDGPEHAALFALNMLINNTFGRTYSEGEIGEMLVDCGAKEIRRQKFKGPNDSAIICAKV